MNMLRFLREKSRNIIVTLRVSILSIFSILFLILLSTVVSIFYFHVSGIVERASFLLMSKSSFAALSEFTLELAPNQAETIISSKNIRQYVVTVNDPNLLIAYMVHILKETQLAEGAFWSDIEGNFIYVKKTPPDHFTAEIIDRTHQPTTITYLLLDIMHRELSRTSAPLTFDPRQTSWYQLAIKSKKAIWSNFYLNRNDEFLGLVVASAAVDDNNNLLGVFGINVSLNLLSQYIAKQKITNNSEFYILDPNGKIIAASDSNANLANIKDISLPGAQSFKHFQHRATQEFKIKVNGINYLATFKPIPLLADAGWLIGIVVPEIDFSQEIHRLENFYLFLDILIFLCGLLIMSKILTAITKPLNRLVQEVERIKSFHLTEAESLPSHISEVVKISNAIEDMKAGLRSFKRYVPASLVRQLVRTGEGVQIGGTKKPLAIFFSDIQNFTAIAEKEDENQLTEQICEYFEELTRIIIRNSGTIDKYIGDSLMTFWGAPLKVDYPCHDAARSALHIKNKLNQLNAIWQKENKPPFFTRIGIHFGEAIVGNIGSSERLNYTVLGDAVNIASRLVDVNKIYGTSILVSDTVYQQLQDEFVFRLVDYVKLKGRLEVTAIYELLGENKADLSFDIDQYSKSFIKGFALYQQQKWVDAIEVFKECIILYSEDSVAKVFIERCQKLAKNPRSHWDGIWRISE